MTTPSSRRRALPLSPPPVNPQAGLAPRIAGSESADARTLLDIWRARAELLDAHDSPAAHAYRIAAAELEAQLQRDIGRSVTLAEGAELSGYSAGHLGRLVRAGTIANVGRRNAPRIRVADLPRKAGHLPPEPARSHIGGTSKGQIVRSIVNTQHGRAR